MTSTLESGIPKQANMNINYSTQANVQGKI